MRHNKQMIIFANIEPQSFYTIKIQVEFNVLLVLGVIMHLCEEVLYCEHC